MDYKTEIKGYDTLVKTATMVTVAALLAAFSMADAAENYKFDFGEGPVAAGYTQVKANTKYSDSQGYGFESGTVSSVDRLWDDDLTTDFLTAKGDMVFSVALPQGNYEVTFILGDGENESETTVWAENRKLMLDRITLAGGVAGMLEYARKERGTVIAGVAIATALMPPLCTVGFGIACLKPAYIFGAAYLFLINSFFIALSTFLVTKFLGFESAAFDEVQRKRNPRVVATVLLLMLVPSIITAIGTIRDNNFTTNAERFIQNNKTIGATYIFDHEINLSGRNQTLDIYLAGEALDYTAKQVLLKNALSYGLHSDQIIFHEEAAVQTINKNELIRDLNEHYLKTIQDLNQTITELQVELARYKGAEKAAEKAAADSAKTKQ